MDYKYYCEFCNGRHYLDFLPQVTTTDKSGQCMNRDTSSALKGFAILVIMLHHMHNEAGIIHLRLLY